jgi:RNA polymerase sigma-70 factor (ECF subfamily)
MLEDKLLIRRFKRGSENAFKRIYEKYKNYLLTLATALLNDVSVAEDIVHDVFLSFAKSMEGFELTGNLKRYLAICVINRARNINKAIKPLNLAADQTEHLVSGSPRPEQSAILAEYSERINNAMVQLKYEQREVITLHLIIGMKFRQISELQYKSINTIQSRYRYGMEKLLSLLDEEAAK